MTDGNDSTESVYGRVESHYNIASQASLTSLLPAEVVLRNLDPCNMVKLF